MEPPDSQEITSIPLSLNTPSYSKVLNTLEMKKDSFRLSAFSRRVSADDYNIADLNGVKDLLINLHKSAGLNSDMHFKSLDHFMDLNTKANISLLMGSVLGSIIGPILEVYIIDMHSTFSTITVAIVGGWGLIINKLGYQTRIEQHRQAKESYDEIINLIEMAIAYANESGSSQTYDFTHVLNEVQQIRRNLNKFTPPIPGSILRQFISEDDK
tara:strand:+ start:7254 stop:7892 length:639 start_codon:yes stop_codon:yes gene_type:complete